MSQIEQRKSVRMIGLRSICTSKDKWHRLLFYDVDKPEMPEMPMLDAVMRINSCSYITYTTKHGRHIVGLSPLHIRKWASMFQVLEDYYHSYYSGDVIRLTRKENETQQLIHLEIHYGEVIPNLFNLFANRFGMQKMTWTRENAKYVLVFEKYRSYKE